MGLLKLKNIKLPALIILLLLTASCAVKKPVTDYNQPQTEAQVIYTINNLPEVLKGNALCKKNSHGARHLVSYITSRPSDSQSFYGVKVSEYDSAASNVWYSFIVYPKTNKIYYLDAKKAKYIPLADWRKQKNYSVVNN